MLKLNPLQYNAVWLATKCSQMLSETREAALSIVEPFEHQASQQDLKLHRYVLDYLHFDITTTNLDRFVDNI